MSNILVRTVSGAVFISLILIPLFLDDSILATIVLALFMLLGLIEYNKLFQKADNIHLNWQLNIFFGTLISSMIIFNDLIDNAIPFRLTVLPAIFIWAMIEIWRNKRNPIQNVAVSIFGLVYVCIPFILAIEINKFDNASFPLLAGMFIIIWANDTFAYLSGRFFGKTKLFERISPKKTWEGTIGGILFSFALALAFSLLFDPEKIWFWTLSVIFIVPAAILGDLFESLLKRSLNIKDSGNIMPGHGGILDRFDASLFAIPFFYFWIEFYSYFCVNFY